MGAWFFVSDLHGHTARYRELFRAIARERPAVVLLGGDLLPNHLAALRPGEPPPDDFIPQFLVRELEDLRHLLGPDYPRVGLILGNDDPRSAETTILDAEACGIWHYLHNRRATLDGFDVCGYACVPPTPFRLKDWERYDVSRYVDPGCLSPEEGHRTICVPEHEIRHGTIRDDLANLLGGENVERTVCLFHSPPYQTSLDRAALDGRSVDHVPLDVHVGSVAIRRFIEERQPAITLHGHIHESARLTGCWREQIGRTHCLSAAHDGPELALVRFEPAAPDRATRSLL